MVPPTQESSEMEKKMDTESIEWKGKFNMKEILSTMSFMEKEPCFIRTDPSSKELYIKDIQQTAIFSIPKEIST